MFGDKNIHRKRARKTNKTVTMKNQQNHINKDNYFVIKMEIVFVASRRVRRAALSESKWQGIYGQEGRRREKRT
jgi:hypothetical protein